VVSPTSCSGCPWIRILPISISWIARIICVSYCAWLNQICWSQYFLNNLGICFMKHNLRFKSIYMWVKPYSRCFDNVVNWTVLHCFGKIISPSEICSFILNERFSRQVCKNFVLIFLLYWNLKRWKEKNANVRDFKMFLLREVMDSCFLLTCYMFFANFHPIVLLSFLSLQNYISIIEKLYKHRERSVRNDQMPLVTLLLT
jgi:hypothetical protein